MPLTFNSTCSEALDKNDVVVYVQSILRDQSGCDCVHVTACVSFGMCACVLTL
jgi:hypothetical protein